MDTLAQEWESATPLKSEWDAAKPVQTAPPVMDNGVVDGVPKWGRDNPNLYAATMTGLDLLPMVANLAKSTGVGIPLSGAINTGARAAQRYISGEPTSGSDMALDFLKGATIEGAGRGVNAAVQGVTNLPAVREGANNFANKIIRSAGKFGTGSGLTPTEQKAMAQTVLDKGYKFNENSWQRMLDNIAGNTSAVDDIYAAGTRAGDTYTAPEVLANGDFGRLLRRGENVRGVAPDYGPRVESVLDTFRKGAAGTPEQTIERTVLQPDFASRSLPMTVTETIPAVPTPYTPTELNVAKRQLYQDIGTSYKNHAVNDATESAQKTLASAIKQTLDESYPGAVPYNLDSSALLSLEPYFARAINRISQRDMVGLGEKIALGSLKDPVALADITPGKLGKLVAAVWDRPEVKSRVALALYKANTGQTLPLSRWKEGLKYMGQVAGPAIRSYTEGQMLTSDPLGIR